MSKTGRTSWGLSPARGTSWRDSAPCRNDLRFVNSEIVLKIKTAAPMLQICRACPFIARCEAEIVTDGVPIEQVRAMKMWDHAGRPTAVWFCGCGRIVQQGRKCDCTKNAARNQAIAERRRLALLTRGTT